MADRVMFISWGPPVRGREQRSMEVFGEAVGLFGSMQQTGRIESFDVVVMRPNGHFNGYIQLHGSADQLAGVRESDDFQRSTADALMCVEQLRQLDGVTNDAVARQMAIYQEAIAKVPQHA
jgi:hypothetical protein